MHLADNEQRYINYLCPTKDQMKHYYAEKTVSCESLPYDPDKVSWRTVWLQDLMVVYLEVGRLVDQNKTQIDSSPRKGGKTLPRHRMQNIKDLQGYFILLALWPLSTG